MTLVPLSPLLPSKHMRCTTHRMMDVTLSIILSIIASAAGLGETAYEYCESGDLRLANGTYFEGRLEICWNNTWGTICNDLWTDVNARVACGQLGFSVTKATTLAAATNYGMGKGPIHLNEVSCTGYEKHLDECSHPPFDDGVTNCIHREDVGLRCYLSKCFSGQTRLFGDSDKGGVEICKDEVWITACADWAEKETNVVCKQLGFSDVGNSIIRTSATFGEPPSPIALKLTCSGKESSVAECSMTKCADGMDYAAIQCKEPDCRDGEVLLDPSPAPNIWSRVLTCHGGKWGAICTSKWSAADAGVVCAQQGHPKENAIAGSITRNGSIPVVMGDVGCHGTESKINECVFSFVDACQDSSRDAAVQCQKRLCEDGEIRLVGESNSLRGRVEVCWKGTWGTVCGKKYTASEANVACRQLGFSKRGAKPLRSIDFRPGIGHITLSDVKCNDNSLKLIDCDHSNIGVNRCTHMDDFGVQCKPRECMENDIRLVGGESTYSGRVEICRGEQWRSMCDNGWSENEAMVVCREIFDAVGHIGSYSGSPNGLLHRPLMCSDGESSLSDCSVTRELGCEYENTAGVTCI